MTTALGSRLSALGDQAIIEYLARQRWFGAKGAKVTNARLVDDIPINWTGIDESFAVVRVAVDVDGDSSTYQLFLTVPPTAPGREPRAAVLEDALEDAEFRRGLADAFVRGATFENGTTRWIIASEGKQALVVPAASPVTLSTSEQTNSSVIIDSKAILKLYRRLESGMHPDVEVTRFLSIERRFPHVPVLLGTIRFEDPAGVTIAGMLQELVPGAVDGWTYALDCSREYFRASDEPSSPAAGPLPFEEEAEQLGVVTRAMHETLASGAPGSDFDLRPATPDDVRRWAQGAAEMIEKASNSLARALKEKRLDRERVPEARAIVARRADYVHWMTELADGVGSDAGANARTHGDYHLGQVLRSSAAQFLVIDFEGEPARPLKERRARHSPLRDVAGMLRSFAYAVAVGSGPDVLRSASYAVRSKRKAHSAKPTAQSAEPRAAIRAARWSRAARDAFLRGYLSDKKGRGALLPRSESNAGRLLGLFEAEKVFYELQYELDHRPEWVWIPLRGIATLYT